MVVEDVIKIYESRGERVTALRGVSIRVEPGSVVAIMGPSGSGKTTLLNLIGGIDRPDAGRVVVDELEIHKLGEEELRRYRLERVGYVFQQHNLIPTLTALENVLLPMTIAGRPDRGRALNLLSSVGLQGKENRLPEELSGGEQQRLALAVALANDPPLIIADEPTGELDLRTGEAIVRLLLSQSRDKGKTVIMTTHDPRVARMADRVVLIEDGTIRGEYEPSRITGATGELGEITAERIIAEYLKSRIEALREEARRLVEALSRGDISPREFVERYQRIEALIEAYRDELARIGSGVEA